MGIDFLHTLTGLTQSLQSFIWGMGIDWLDTVTSVDYLGGMGVDWLDTVTSVVYLGGMGVNLLDSHFSRISGGYGG